jgi:serine/threonine protein kinase
LRSPSFHPGRDLFPFLSPCLDLIHFRSKQNMILFVRSAMEPMGSSCKKSFVSCLIYLLLLSLPLSLLSSAIDKSKEKNVAIKKISRVFDDPVDAKRILREIKLMKKFNHENVSPLLLLLLLPSSEFRSFEFSISVPLHQRWLTLKIFILCR